MTTDPADPDIEETQSFHSFPPRGAEDDAGVLPPYRYHFGERSHVNVNRAQQDFEQLRRQLTKESADLQEHGADSTAEKGENDKFDLLNLMKGVKARQEEQGVRRVNLGLTWRDLNVYGDDVSHSEIPMFLTPLYKMFNLKAYWKRFTHRGPKPTSHILHNLTGFVKEGGMLLVLGRPGSGCSTLLRVLSNETRTYKRITGEVHFSGIPAKEFAKHYRGEVQYNQEEDAHHPTLTVDQTLRFATKCKVPQNRLTRSKRDFVSSLVDNLEKMYGLKAAANTLVGNAFIRGISGGERKRLSIAEQFATRSSIDVWDGSTRGLDAASALDYVKSLRIVCDIMGKATIASIYQASEDIYNQFDRVLIIDKGRCLYHGPISEAVPYFYELGFEKPTRETTPDFLTSLTDPNSRHFRKGYEDKAPKTAEELEERWKNSQACAKIQNRMDEYEDRINQVDAQSGFREAVSEAKQKRASSKSPYTVSFYQQFKACFVREWQLILGSPASKIFQLTFNFIVAFVVGSCFYKQKLNSTGAFTRGGILFFSLLFNVLSAQAELNSSMYGRPVMYKHKNFAVHRPSAMFIAKSIMDIPFFAANILIFSVILYWLAGLRASGGAFFIFMAFLLMATIANAALFRLIAYVSPNIDFAHMISSIMLIVMILYTGYLIPYSAMRGWFIWFYWANPLAYALGGLLMNEYRGLVFECSGPSLVPSGTPQYSNVANQVCTIRGATAGSNTVTGEAYLLSAVSLHASRRGVWFVSVAAFAILFWILSMLVIEHIEFGKGGYTVNEYKRSALKRMNAQKEEERRRQEGMSVGAQSSTIPQSEGRSSSSAGGSSHPSRSSAEGTRAASQNSLDTPRDQGSLADQDSVGKSDDTGPNHSSTLAASSSRGTSPSNHVMVASGVSHSKQPSATRSQSLGDSSSGASSGDLDSNSAPFLWRHINYTVPVKSEPSGKRQLLNDVSGWARPGNLTALMGSSGAGKTTLMDVLVRRKTTGVIEGETLLCGREPGIDFKRLTGYCEQMDVHNEFATVRETLRFSAEMRQPADVPVERKHADVDKIITLLEMDNIADALIGNVEQGLGISVEERKRLTIANELVARPRVLFLDEPTSGLDSQSALNIVRFLRLLADKGQSILCTIHQPSSLLFQSFDRLMLLARGGRTTYFGDLGEDSHILIDYFERNGAEKCPEDANPAEYILDVVGSGSAAKDDRNWADVWEQSPEQEAVMKELDELWEKDKADAPEERPYTQLYPHPIPVQIGKLMVRTLIDHWRNVNYMLSRVLLQLFIALLLGFSFIQLGDGTVALQNRVFALFQTSVLGITLINTVQPRFFDQLNLFHREQGQGTYHWFPWTLAVIVSELPFALLSSTLFFVIFYYTVGFSGNGDRSGYFFILYTFFTFFALSLGQLVAAWTPNLFAASMVNPFIGSMLALFCGVTIPPQAMPGFWSRWMYWISTYHYGIEGFVVNDLHEKNVQCKTEEYFAINPPSGQSCGDYMTNFFDRGSPGYIQNPEATTGCQYCPYKVGDEFYATYNWHFIHRWRNFAIIIGYCAFNWIFTFIGVRRYRARA